MLSREDIIKLGLEFDNTILDAPFHDDNWQLLRDKLTNKVFVWTFIKDGFLNITVKLDPLLRDFYKSSYPESVIPAYHLSKQHWTQVRIDGLIPEEEIKKIIGESYFLVTDSPTKRIYEAVKQIPYGRVATYAQVAELAGNRKMSRAVGNALHKNPDPEHIPCFRVVNSKGELAGEFAFGGEKVQARLLEAEGVEVVCGKVDLEKYGLFSLFI
ncbi:MAG: methylated-DNA--[protein]-cysteine S-methyltransferase [Lachnospiraceae bacterium]|nr:methylated-DNA--[protein]-cysteine S-methyltransferase [Lachnospiraceae bacterium]